MDLTAVAMHIKNDVEHCNAYALYLQQALLENYRV